MGRISDQRGASALCDPDENRTIRRFSFLLTVGLVACGEAMVAEPEATPAIMPAPVTATKTCGDGAHLTGDMTGAIETSFAFVDRELKCESMRRPDDAGARLRFLGGEDPNRLSVIIAIPGLQKGATGTELVSTVTVTVDGSGRFFSSADLDACWTDISSQNLLEAARYSIVGETYCILPLAEVNGSGAITVADLAFASIIDWDTT